MKLTHLLLLMTALAACKEKKVQSPGSFAYDQSFIQSHDTSAVTLSDGDAKIIVSPKYQAKVFTSTTEGDNGQSLGWINYKAFNGPEDAHMNAYGGENRLWLGPEGGPFSLFFSKGSKMVFQNWKTPAPFDTESWSVSRKTEASVRMFKDMNLENYAGATFLIQISREVKLLSQTDISGLLGLQIGDNVKAVGYQTSNTIINKGPNDWDEKNGMPCMWVLDMFPPSDQTMMVIPYKEVADDRKPATTDYFGEIPEERIKFDNNVLYFRADGNHRSKLGIHPKRAKNRAGSYDAKHNILTITLFDIANDSLYLNQEWLTNKEPFSGDAVNAYNDGPLADGKQLGPFYELESVSPAAFLKSGQSQTHNHAVFHFSGSETGLNKISQKAFGVSLNQIVSALNKDE